MVIFDQVELKNWYINDVKKGEGRGEATVFSKEKVNTMGESESIKKWKQWVSVEYVKVDTMGEWESIKTVTNLCSS